MKNDPENPLIRRHMAFDKLHQLVIHRSSLFSSKYSIPTEVLAIICHLNTQYLHRTDDIPLNSKNAWRILFDRHKLQAHHRSLVQSPPPTNHRSIYITLRKSTKSEIRLGRQKRIKPKFTKPLDSEYKSIKSFVSIDQSSSDSIMYIAPNLHTDAHGSMNSNELEPHHILLDFLDIHNTQMNATTAGKKGIDSCNGIIFVTDKNKHIQQLNKKIIGGFQRFHTDLVDFMLRGGVTDNARMRQLVDQFGESVNNRCRFGFGRVQPRTNKKNWTLHGERMPTIDVSLFRQMPSSLQDRFMTVVEHAHKFLLCHYPDAFPDKFRNENCASLLNNHLGFPFSCSKFEYFDIVISRNIALIKHIDTKNDHREGYNYSVIYSFYCLFLGLEYKVSIIMTTRCTVGAPVERIHKKSI